MEFVNSRATLAAAARVARPPSEALWAPWHRTGSVRARLEDTDEPDVLVGVVRVPGERAAAWSGGEDSRGAGRIRQVREPPHLAAWGHVATLAGCVRLPDPAEQRCLKPVQDARSDRHVESRCRPGSIVVVQPAADAATLMVHPHILAPDRAIADGADGSGATFL